MRLFYLYCNQVLALDSTYADADALLQLIDESELRRKTSILNIEITSNSDGATSNYHDAAYQQLDAKQTLSVEQPVLSADHHHQLKHYSPSVIPIVKTKKSMVIVGAVRREDLERSVCCLKDILTVARRPPVSPHLVHFYYLFSKNHQIGRAHV